jgi:dTDP-4-amino-4,6-dideoxygalactose transaminase
MRGVRVPFADLGRATAELRGEIDAAVARVLDSGWYVLGQEGEAFESEFALQAGAAHCAGLASGTDAIEVALRALGVGPGDEVVTQANTCVPTVAAIARAGATPVLCDVEPEAATIDPASLAGVIGPKTKAVVPVHLYGQIGDLDAVASLCAERGLPLVEDCAQAHGARIGDRAAGTVGAVGCFSFYPTKNLGALGDGGAVVTSDPALDERIRLVRQYGQTDRYHHEIEGVNSRLDELQAAILRAKLPRLEAWTERRGEIAARYSDALDGTGARPLAVLPGRRHAFHLYVLEVEDRDGFQSRMEDAGVATLVHYPKPIHGHPPYSELGHGPVPLDVSDRMAGRIVSLPLFPELTEEEVAAVADAARAAASPA